VTSLAKPMCIVSSASAGGLAKLASDQMQLVSRPGIRLRINTYIHTPAVCVCCSPKLTTPHLKGEAAESRSSRARKPDTRGSHYAPQADHINLSLFREPGHRQFFPRAGPRLASSRRRTQGFCYPVKKRQKVGRFRPKVFNV
jgi:hypothetical protein